MDKQGGCREMTLVKLPVTDVPSRLYDMLSGAMTAP